MGKGKRKRERKAKRERREPSAASMHSALTVIEGGGEPDAPRFDPAPLKDRPEYRANMRAWKEAGSPPGPGPR